MGAEVFHSDGRVARYDEADSLLATLRKRLIAVFATSRTRVIVTS